MGDETKVNEDDVEAASNLKKARDVNLQGNRARIDRLAEIADNNEQMRASEMVETEDGNLKAEPTEEEKKEAAAESESMEAEQALAEMQAKALQEEGVDPATGKETPEGQEEAEEKVSEPADTKVVNGETYYLTVVNGTEKWLTLTQLRTTAQKVESADQYLAAAAESVRNAARLDLSHKPDEPSKIDEVDLEKTLISAVQGDQEAIKKLASVFNGLREARAKPSEVTPDVLQQIDERWSFRRAAEWFEDQYQDLLGDPVLKKLVYDKDAELAKDSPTMPYKKRLKTAGDDIRDWLKKKTGTTEVKAAVASETKADRKKTLVNVPSAAARQTPPADEEAEESVEDVIQKMAKARGQARAMVHRPTHRF